jgi:hypothetical protein
MTWANRRHCAVLLVGAECLLLGACIDIAGPGREPEISALPLALTAITGKIGGNAVYQVRKESGASAYDATDNTTYITYNGADMDIYVRAYHNTTSTWGPLTLAKPWTHYAGGVRWSYHNYSSMVLAADGKLHIFQADHGRALYEIVPPAAHSVEGP